MKPSKTVEMNSGTSAAKRMKLLGMILLASLLGGCATTSGSTRLDETGERLADETADDQTPETAAFYIQSLHGGLVSRLPGLKMTKSDLSRALEAEYKALETAPGGQSIAWEGSRSSGQVVAAVPYQVGSQNCRQYSHVVTPAGGAAQTVRGAACRNANGSWTPLS